MVKKTKGGHIVNFVNTLTLMSEDAVCDFIDMFFNYNENGETWYIKVESGDFNGQHQYNPNTKEHTITFNENKIKKRYAKGLRIYGGNLKLDDISVSMAAALVLAHELQHANQSKLHRGNELFYGNLGGYDVKGKPRMKHYKGRACERDAREFVDGHLNEIFAYFNLPAPRRNKVYVADDTDELIEVANLLLECEEVSMDDVRDELRFSRILNPKNVQRMLEILRSHGVTSTTVQ